MTLETTNRVPVGMEITEKMYLSQPHWDPWDWIVDHLSETLRPYALRLHHSSLESKRHEADPLRPWVVWTIRGVASQARVDQERIGL